ncbi:MAG: tetratricopeptide repeat protein [Polyangia bacterium]
MRSSADLSLRPRQREQLVRPWHVILLGILMVTALVLLVPTPDTLEQHVTGADRLSLQYLRLMLRMRPDDAELKLRLVQALLDANQFEEAQRLLTELLPKLNDPRLKLRANLLALTLDLARYMQTPQGTLRDHELQPRVAQDIEALLQQPLTVDELIRLATASLSIGRPDLATRVYLRLAEVDPQRRNKWLAEAAQQANASNQPGLAGRLYAQLVQDERDPKAARRFALLALQALVGAGLGDEALELARRYAERFPGDHEILEAAAKLALASGHPGVAAGFYDELSRAVSDPKAQLRYARLALTTYTAANQPEPAMRAASGYLARFPGDLELSRQAIRLALGNQQPRLAQAWGRALLRQFPNDTALITEQINIELAVGDAAEALALAQRLVAQRPASLQPRERLAQIARWTGNPHLALEQLVYLASHGGKKTYLDQALKLAPQIYEYEALAKLMKIKARQGRLSNAELAALVEAMESVADPEGLVELLTHYLSRYADHREAWEALAAVHERRGDLPAALQTYEHLAGVFGSDTKEITHRAELLWQLHRPQEAYVLLRDALDHAGVARTQGLLSRAELASQALRPTTLTAAGVVRPSEPESAQEIEPPPAGWTLSGSGAGGKAVTLPPEQQSFLHLLGQLFWHSEPRPESMDEYRRLWRDRVLIAESAWRYSKMAKDAGELGEAIAVAEEAFTRFNDGEFLLWAMDTAFGAERWRDMERLIEVAHEHHETFATDKRYALMLAEYYTRIGDYEKAQRMYLKVVSLDPDSAAARAGLLWLLMDHSDDRARQFGRRNRWALRRFLSAWADKAKEEPSLWLPFATGWAMLGRSRDAVAWYQREWSRRPNDRLWLLGYISTLDAVSRSSDARRLRRYALEQLQPDVLRAAHDKATPAEREVLLAYTGLVRDAYGAGKGSRWMNAVRRAPIDPGLQRGLLAVWRDTESNVEPSYFVQDSRNVTAKNPWGRYAKKPKPGQQQQPDTIADVVAPPDELPTPPLQPVRVLDQDAAAGETEIPVRSQLLSIEAGLQTISDLSIYSAAASGLLARGSLGVGGHVRVNQLSLNGSDDPRAAATEVDLAGYGMWRNRVGRLTVGIGANLRGDANIVSGWLEQSFLLGRNGTLQLGVHLNELSQDTRWLRIYGARHRATASYNTTFATDGYLTVQGSYLNYHTRTNEDIANGVNADLEIGYRIRRVRPRWTVRMSGGYTRVFHSTTELPSFGDTSSYAQTVLDALPPEFAALGIGTRVEHRFPGVAPIGAGRWRYFGDVWAGWMWPLNIPAFEIHGGVSLGLPRRQELGLSAFVANNRWLGPGVVNAGVTLRYLFR